LAALLLRRLACHITRAQLASRFGPRLAGVLDQYGRQLYQWRSQVLADMRRSFTAKADFYRVQCEQTQGTQSDLAAIERDLKRLKEFKAID
jgi:transposase-like protein